MYRFIIICLAVLLSTNNYAQDSLTNERGFVFGISAGVYLNRNNISYQIPAADKIWPYAVNGTTLYKDLRTIIPLTINVSVPLRYKWDLLFECGLGIYKGINIYAMPTAINNLPGGAVVVDEFTIDTLNFFMPVTIFKINLSRQLISRKKFWLDFGAGVRGNTHKLSGDAQINLQLLAIAHLRISEKYWLTCSPSFSRNFVAIQIGLEKQFPLASKPKPDHWYIRTYEHEE